MKIAMTMLTAWLLVSGCTTTVEGSLGPQKGSLDKRVEAHLALARGYLEQRDYERARGPLESALELDPQSSEAHVLLAILYQAQGEENKLVQRQYELALRYDPTNAQALNNKNPAEKQRAENNAGRRRSLAQR